MAAKRRRVDDMDGDSSNFILAIIHVLLADPEARYTDLGPDYYSQHMHARHQPRNHVKSLERPDTGQLHPAAD